MGMTDWELRDEERRAEILREIQAQFAREAREEDEQRRKVRYILTAVMMAAFVIAAIWLTH